MLGAMVVAGATDADGEAVGEVAGAVDGVEGDGEVVGVVVGDTDEGVVGENDDKSEFRRRMGKRKNRTKLVDKYKSF